MAGEIDITQENKFQWHDPLDINRTVGNTCQFSTDCGPGSKCMKQSGQINGVCIR